MSDEAPRRLEELILYVAAKMHRDQHVGIGRMKLAKLLWRIDFTAYWQLEHPISEATYEADAFGPAPTQEPLATRDLSDAGRFEWVREWDAQWMPVARDEPDMSIFSDEECELIDRVVDRYRNTSGRQMVEIAHEFPGWIHAWRDGEGKGSPVPYQSIFWSRRTEVTPEEDEHAAGLAAEFAHLMRD
jgi:uncharacterized phage-associated protein